MTNSISNMTDCFVFLDKLTKKSTRCLFLKITNKTSGPNKNGHSENLKGIFYDTRRNFESDRIHTCGFLPFQTDHLFEKTPKGLSSITEPSAIEFEVW